MMMPPPATLEVHWDNYVRAILGQFSAGSHYYSITSTTQSALKPLRNSLIIATGSTALSLILGIPAAYAFSRFPFKRSRDAQFYILSQRMAPPIAMILPLFTLFRYAGLNNTYIGIILTHMTFNLPLVVWLMKGFFDEVPIEIDESASIEGCSAFGRLTRVVLPLTTPGIVSLGLLCFLFSWNEFLFALVLSGPDTTTIPVYAAQFWVTYTIDWGAFAAAIIISIIPTVLITLVFQRYFLRGLTLGAVKG